MQKLFVINVEGIFDFFIFWGKGEKRKGLEKVNVKEGFEGLYQMGDKSGIWRFYRRVRKNIFYEGEDKGRKEGFWRDGRAKLYFFKIFLGGWRRIRNFVGECIFGVLGWGKKRKIGKGIGFLGYVWEGTIY